MITLVDVAADQVSASADACSLPLAALRYALHRDLSQFSRLYRRVGLVLLAALPGGVVLASISDLWGHASWPEIRGELVDMFGDLEGLVALAILSLPFVVFYIRERRAKRGPRPWPTGKWRRGLRSAGRWISVVSFAYAMSVPVAFSFIAWVDLTSGASLLGVYKLAGTKLVPRAEINLVGQLRSFSALAGVFICLALIWRLRHPWRTVVARMAGTALVANMGAMAFMIALSGVHERESGYLGLVLTCAFLSLWVVGPLMRAASVAEPPAPMSRADLGKDTGKYIAAAATSSQIMIIMIILATDIVLSHHQVTDVLIKARDAFAASEASRALTMTLPRDRSAIHELAKNDVWKDRSGFPFSQWRIGTVEQPWLTAASQPLEERDWSEAQRLTQFVNRSVVTATWQSIHREELKGGRWVEVWAAWVSAPAPITGGVVWLPGPTFSEVLTTIYAIKVDVGTTANPQRPLWTHTVVRESVVRGRLSQIGETMRVPMEQVGTTSWAVTKWNSPEYDFARWLRSVGEDRHDGALRGIALEQGIDTKDGEPLVGVLTKVERQLINRSVSVPTIGLNMPPFPAIALLALVILYLLMSIGNALRRTLRDPDLGGVEPWLLLDAEGRAERWTATVWLIILLSGPWIIAGGLVHMTLRQAMVNGEMLTGPSTVLVVVAAVLYTLYGSRIALGIASLVVSLRMSREEAARTRPSLEC